LFDKYYGSKKESSKEGKEEGSFKEEASVVPLTKKLPPKVGSFFFLC